MLIIFAGRPGTGKTTIARALAERIGAAYVRVDTIEQAVRRDLPLADVGATGYLVAYAVAADNLRAGLSVIADCVNAAEISRKAWTAVATEASQPYLNVEIVCSDENEHRLRVENRVPDIAGHVLPSWDDIQAIRMAPMAGVHLTIDTAKLSVQAAVELICEHIRGRRAHRGYK